MEISRSISLKEILCEVCEKKESKYRCPACDLTTCSLYCCKRHKKEHSCDGVRIRTSFVKLNDFNNLHLLSDYRLLDEISSKVDGSRRDKLKKAFPPRNPFSRLNKLKGALCSRGADLVVLPSQFERHKINTSFFDGKVDEVQWTIQFTFLNANNLSLCEEKCSESLPLSNLISKVLSSSTHKALKAYKKSLISSLSVLMKAEKVKEADKKFYLLDLNKSVRENLVGKVIVEFPHLFILINGFYTANPFLGQEEKNTNTNYFSDKGTEKINETHFTSDDE